jgi:hypothetical protein
MSNQKVAVCLCGEPRLIEYASKSIKQVFSEINVDYFCHAWTENTVYIPENTKKRLTETDIIESSFKEDPRGLKQYITNIYNPRDIIVEKCNVDRVYGQFTTAERCVNLTKKYQDDYDVILKMRFDTPIMWNTEGVTIYDDIERNPDSVFVNSVRMNRHQNGCYIEISDHGPFFGYKETMYKYFDNMHEKIKRYVENFKSCRDENKFEGEPHKIFYKNNVPEYMWYILFCMQDVYPTNYKSMYHALARPGIPHLNKIPQTHEEQRQYVKNTENYARWRDFILYSNVFEFVVERDGKIIEIEGEEHTEYDSKLNYDKILNEYLKKVNRK